MKLNTLIGKSNDDSVNEFGNTMASAISYNIAINNVVIENGVNSARLSGTLNIDNITSTGSFSLSYFSMQKDSCITIDAVEALVL